MKTLASTDCKCPGAIEVSSTSAKTAKQVTRIADGGSEDDDAAAEAFEAASKKVRISAVQKDDEISLNLYLSRFFLKTSNNLFPGKPKNSSV